MREKFSAIKHIILIYYVAIISIISLFYVFVPFDQSIDQTISTILLVYLLIFPIVMFYTLSYALHVFLFTLAFITGFYGFYQHSIDNHSISNALYFTFRLYLLDLADVFTQDGSSPVKYPLILEIGRWTAASYTISTIFIAMYRTLEKEISLFIAQTFGKHHIVFSYNEKSRLLIRDLVKQKERVIVVDEKFSPETENMLEQMKVTVIHASMKDDNIFQVTGVKRAKSVSLFHNDDQDSLYVLMHLDQYIRQQKYAVSLNKVIVQIENERYQSELESFLKKVEHFAFPVDIINVYEEVAKRFWKSHSSILTSDSSSHFLVVGYEKLGKQMIHEVSKKQTHNKAHITVIDHFAKEETDDFVTMIPFDMETESLRLFITDEKTTYSHIFICLDEDYVDLMEGIDLSELFPETPIYINFTDESIEQTFMIATTKTKKSLYSIGTIQDVLTKQYLQL
ncbi:MAG TPA: NAD-binding protein [Bacillota bacterium]|nr:NAD-binding protein [Bacillota bacterium]